MTGTSKNPALTAIFESAAPEHLAQIRTLILETANKLNVAPIEETLKWGQPAFVPPKKFGTTIRLGAAETHAVLYVHCQTNLVQQFKEIFPTEFTYEGNRAVHIPLHQPINAEALSQVIALALTYHQKKKAAT